MQELVYAMRFTGWAQAAGENGDVLTTTTTAPSSILTCTVGTGGLSGVFELAAGGEVTFASEVTFTGASGFQEVGEATFGDGNVLRFSTVGSGYLSRSADPVRKHGAVVWRVDDGEGQLAGASGLITSNFFVGDDLQIIDRQLGVILLP